LDNKVLSYLKYLRLYDNNIKWKSLGQFYFIDLQSRLVIRATCVV